MTVLGVITISVRPIEGAPSDTTPVPPWTLTFNRPLDTLKLSLTSPEGFTRKNGKALSTLVEELRLSRDPTSLLREIFPCPSSTIVIWDINLVAELELPKAVRILQLQLDLIELAEQSSIIKISHRQNLAKRILDALTARFEPDEQFPIDTSPTTKMRTLELLHRLEPYRETKQATSVRHLPNLPEWAGITEATHRCPAVKRTGPLS